MKPTFHSSKLSISNKSLLIPLWIMLILAEVALVIKCRFELRSSLFYSINLPISAKPNGKYDMTSQKHIARISIKPSKGSRSTTID